MSSEASTDRPSRLPLLTMGAVVAMMALVTVSLLAIRSPASYPDGSPEAALQAFVIASIEGDGETMLTLVTETTRRRCQNDYGSDSGSGQYRDEQRVQLESIEVDGLKATATVVLRRVDSGDVFGSSGWERTADYDLEQVDGEWLVDRGGWPYAFERCSGGGN